MPDNPMLPFFDLPDYTFNDWLNSTAALQEHFFDGDPGLLEDRQEVISFLTWNVQACHAELVELLDEVGWKPWATSDHLHRQRILGEAVDLLHFVGNILRAIGVDGPQLTAAYQTKQKRNMARQRSGYDGLKEKCPSCRKDLEEVPHNYWLTTDLGPEKFQCDFQSQPSIPQYEQGECNHPNWECR